MAKRAVELKDIGPLQFIAVEFDKPEFKGELNDELQKLRDENLIRIVDGAVIYKDETGKVATLEESDLSALENAQYGAAIGSIIGLGSENEETVDLASEAMAERFSERYEYGLDEEDVKDITAAMPEGKAVLFLLVEHRWLIPLRNAMRNMGGVLLAQDFLSPELLFAIGKELSASTASSAV